MHIFGCEILYIRIYTDTYSYTILALENDDFFYNWSVKVVFKLSVL